MPQDGALFKIHASGLLGAQTENTVYKGLSWWGRGDVSTGDTMKYEADLSKK